MYEVKPAFQLSYQIKNYLETDIVIKNKLGMKTVIPSLPVPRGLEKTVYVEVMCRSADMFKVDINPKVSSNQLDRLILTELEKDLIKVRETFLNQITDTHYASYYQCVVKLSQIKPNYKDNGYESEALGFTLELQDDSTPYFYKEDSVKLQLGTLKNNHEELNNQSETIYTAAILVDKENRIGDLWTVVFGESFKIRAVCDESLNDGLYLYQGNNLNKRNYIPIHLLTEDALKQHGFFKVQLDAYKEPHGKYYTELNKERDSLRKEKKALKEKLESIEESLIDLKRKYQKEIDKYEFTNNQQTLEIKELNRKISETKERDNFLDQLRKIKQEQEKRFLAEERKEKEQELQKVKQNSGINIILDLLKGIGSFVSILFNLGKLFA